MLTRKNSPRFGFLRSLRFASLSTLLLSILLASAQVSANEVRLAVASNFFATAQQLAALFERETEHSVRMSSASTGKLAIQIKHGAPFDIFLAADSKRPERLVKQGLTLSPASIYATGQLALYSKNLRIDQQGLSPLLKGEIKRLAIANPESAPYGLAAQQFLKTLQLPPSLIIVRGDNVSQTLQFATTNNVDAAFISLAQAMATKEGYYAVIKSDEINPIHQKVVLLKQAKNNPAADQFLSFLYSKEAQRIIEENGYLIERH